jgi:thiol:disulfide interchange protein DsbA
VKSGFLSVLAAAAAGLFASHASLAQSDSKLEVGTHYQELAVPQPTSAEPGKVEVAEIFMFGCPGCFGFEPHLTRWLETKPDYVSFVRIPALWNPLAETHARAYYTAEVLGKAEEIAGPFFTEVHTNGNHLDTEAKLTQFFANFGVEPATFSNTFKSFAVDAKLGRAKDLVERYRVRSTPTVVVNGKYLTTGQLAGTYPNWFAIIDELAAREHAAGGN